MSYYQYKTKYSNQKTKFKGRLYDSKGEAGLALELHIRKQRGDFIKVDPQVSFPLFGKNGGKICTHKVDFLVTLKDKTTEVYEYKGVATAVWRIKLKLFTDNYPEIPYNVVTAKERKRIINKNV